MIYTIPLKKDVKNGEIHGELTDGVEATDENKSKSQLLLAVRGAASAPVSATSPTSPHHERQGGADGHGEGENVAQEGD